MNCEQVKASLSPYLDNVLAAEERRKIATHLEICSECNATLADFRRFDTLLSQLPRISPGVSLHDSIFSSPEYLELIGASGIEARRSLPTRPYKSVRAATDRGEHYPQLVALPGGRKEQTSSSSEVPGDLFATPDRTKGSRPRQGHWGQRILRTALVATVLLALGVGGLISWTLWQRQAEIAHTTTGMMPPAGLQQGPIPAGIRFLFLRNGALWSAPIDGRAGILRLTPAHTTVASHWVVRPAQAGRSAGNMVAYIDLQQGFVHLIRSDGQNDTIIQQPLLKRAVPASTLWNTDTGATILSSLSWSNDGNMLAFVADPTGATQPGLYIYTVSSNKLQTAALPVAGAVSHLSWSPDNIRIGFAVMHNGNSSVLDYNTQNQGVLILQSGASIQANAGDTVLSLQWSPNANAPALTWSTGQPGNVHNIWVQRVGIGGGANPTLLASGNYTQADYSPAGHNGIGSWLLIMNNAGVAGDILSVDLSAFVEKLTTGQQVNVAQWSPDGNTVDYFAALSKGTDILHVVNMSTGTDTRIATGVAAEPLPIWSADSQHLAYSTGVHGQVVAIHTPGIVQTLKPQGKVVAFSWSVTSPSQLILAIGDGQQGLYLVDSQNGMTQQLAKETPQGSILWTQIP